MSIKVIDATLQEGMQVVHRSNKVFSNRASSLQDFFGWQTCESFPEFTPIVIDDTEQPCNYDWRVRQSGSIGGIVWNRAMSLSPGKTIDDRYQILTYLGGGGMGEVYQAKELALNRLVAIKVLPLSTICDPKCRSQFKREGKLLSSLQHPNLITFYRFGIIDRQIPYLAMEYLEGKTVRQLLEEGQPSVEYCLTLVKQVCEGMSWAHKAHVIHRDLKPENLMLVGQSTEVLKVVDFGLGRMLSEDQRVSQDLTGTGVILGTPPYMSWEQCMGRKVDQRADIYALGCILYELLTGSPPFSGDTPISIIYQHLNVPPPELAATWTRKEELVQGLSFVLQKALSKDPEARYQTMTEFSSDIDLVLAGNGDAIEPAKTAATFMQSGHWRASASLGVLLALLLLPGLLWVAVQCPWENLVPFANRMQLLEWQGDTESQLALKDSRKYVEALNYVDLSRPAEVPLCRLVRKIAKIGFETNNTATFPLLLEKLFEFYAKHPRLLAHAAPGTDNWKHTGIGLMRALHATVIALPAVQIYNQESLRRSINLLAPKVTNEIVQESWMVREMQMEIAQKFHDRPGWFNAMRYLAIDLGKSKVDPLRAENYLKEIAAQRIKSQDYRSMILLNQADGLCQATLYKPAIACTLEALRYWRSPNAAPGWSQAMSREYQTRMHTTYLHGFLGSMRAVYSQLQERGEDLSPIVDSIIEFFDTKELYETPHGPGCFEEDAALFIFIFESLDQVQRKDFYDRMIKTLDKQTGPVSRCIRYNLLMSARHYIAGLDAYEELRKANQRLSKNRSG